MTFSFPSLPLDPQVTAGSPGMPLAATPATVTTAVGFDVVLGAVAEATVPGGAQPVAAPNSGDTNLTEFGTRPLPAQIVFGLRSPLLPASDALAMPAARCDEGEGGGKPGSQDAGSMRGRGDRRNPLSPAAVPAETESAPVEGQEEKLPPEARVLPTLVTGEAGVVAQLRAPLAPPPAITEQAEGTAVGAEDASAEVGRGLSRRVSLSNPRTPPSVVSLPTGNAPVTGELPGALTTSRIVEGEQVEPAPQSGFQSRAEATGDRSPRATSDEKSSRATSNEKGTDVRSPRAKSEATAQSGQPIRQRTLESASPSSVTPEAAAANPSKVPADRNFVGEATSRSLGAVATEDMTLMPAGLRPASLPARTLQPATPSGAIAATVAGSASEWVSPSLPQVPGAVAVDPRSLELPASEPGQPLVGIRDGRSAEPIFDGPGEGMTSALRAPLAPAVATVQPTGIRLGITDARSFAMPVSAVAAPSSAVVGAEGGVSTVSQTLSAEGTPRVAEIAGGLRSPVETHAVSREATPRVSGNAGEAVGQNIVRTAAGFGDSTGSPSPKDPALHQARAAVTANTGGQPVAEKIAAPRDIPATKLGRVRGETIKQSVTPEAEQVASKPPTLGIASAKSQAAMSFASLLETPPLPEVAPADTGMGARTPSANPAVAAERAVEAVMDVAERANTRERSSVTLQFDLHGTPLDVRVVMRGGEVQTTFNTNSPELRAALQAEWAAVTDSLPAEKAQHFSAPVFASHDGTSTASGGGDTGARQRQFEAPSDRPGSFPAARTSSDTPVETSPVRQPASVATAHHLHTLA